MRAGWGWESGVGCGVVYGNFDIVWDHFFCVLQRDAPPHAPCAVTYVVLSTHVDRGLLMFGIRCHAQVTSSGTGGIGEETEPWEDHRGEQEKADVTDGGWFEEDHVRTCAV